MKTRTGGFLFLLPLLLPSGSLLSQDQPETVRAVPVTERSADWPRSFTVDDADVMLYEPRVESWDGKKLVVRCAAGVQFSGTVTPLYGSFRAQADTISSGTTRTVSLFNFTADEVRLDDAPDKLAAFTRAVKALAPEKPLQVSMDDLLAQTPAGTVSDRVVTQTKTTAPAIIVKYHPALLVPFDGKPVFRRVAVSGLEAAVNTPATVLRPEGADAPLYLLTNDGMWLAADSLDGPWRAGMAAPAGLSRVPENHPVAQALNQFAGRGTVLSTIPEVVVTTSPAELIVFDGKPIYDRVADISLARAANTETPLFFHFDRAAFFTLLSGRWFSAPDLPGPWTYVAHDQLPAEFAQIPVNDPSADVRASIAGTREAQEAVVEAQIPQVARVNVNDAPPLDVDYDGEPVFEPVAGTDLSYAVNTPYDIVRCEGRYYCCRDGLWFVADAPWRAPWRICGRVPHGIYLIPPSCPLYHVRYCEVIDPGDGWYEYSCAPGYWGTYIDPYTHVCVFGTGYRYPSYFSSDYYCGRPWTYGYGSYYRRHFGFVRDTHYIAHTSWLHHLDHNARTLHHADLVSFGGRFDAAHWHSNGGRSEPFAAWHDKVKTHAVVAAEIHSSPRMEIRKPSDPKPNVVLRHDTAGFSKALSFDSDVRAGQKGELYRHRDSGWEQRESGHWKESDKGHPVDPKVIGSITRHSQDTHVSSRNERERAVIHEKQIQVAQPFVMPKGRAPQDIVGRHEEDLRTKHESSKPKIEIRNDPPRTERSIHVNDSPPVHVERHEQKHEVQQQQQQQMHIEHHEQPKIERHEQPRVERHVETPQPRHIDVPQQPRVEHHEERRVEHHEQPRMEQRREEPKHEAPARHEEKKDDKKDDKKKH